jgi:hypothetical protein
MKQLEDPMEKTVLYHEKPKGWSYALTLATAVSLLVSSVCLITLIISGVLFNDPANLIVFATAPLALVHLVVSSSLYISISKHSSLAAEILFDAKAITSGVKLKSYSSVTVLTVSFVFMYFWLLPYAFYLLIRYRKVLTTALDPFYVVETPDRNFCIAYVMHRLYKKAWDKEIIPEDVLNEHFVNIGNIMFIRDRSSATFLQLSYTEEKILEAFMIDGEEIFSAMHDIRLEMSAAIDSTQTTKAIKRSFRFW